MGRSVLCAGCGMFGSGPVWQVLGVCVRLVLWEVRESVSKAVVFVKDGILLSVRLPRLCAVPWKPRHSLQGSTFSSAPLGDSCRRCLHWRAAALDDRTKQEDWAAQSHGASWEIEQRHFLPTYRRARVYRTLEKYSNQFKLSKFFYIKTTYVHVFFFGGG